MNQKSELYHLQLAQGRILWAVLAGILGFLPPPAGAQSDGGAPATNRQASAEASKPSKDPIARIREEGLNHSQAAKTLSYLSDVIGPRLTGSPNLKRANEWTRDQLASWGLTNAHLEAWGPFGRGWTVQRFSAQVVEPQTFNLIACPNAWTPGLTQPLLTNVVFLDTGTNADFEKYKGKLAGLIVLTSSVREMKTPFEPFAVRMNDTNLLELANAGDGTPMSAGLFPAFPARATPAREVARAFGQRRAQSGGGDERDAEPGTNAVRRGSSPEQRAAARSRFRSQSRALPFLAKEGAALVVNPSSRGEGGTVFVTGASVPSDNPGPGSLTNTPRAWATNVPAIPPQITVALEDYNRMVRMIQLGEQLKMAVDLQVQFHDGDLMAYNTLAEIPGSDLKDQVVMLGGHLDSWHSGTGATDNGAGVAACMEAVRIISTLKLQPRRTIRIGLWSGEEQGLYGSKAYVAKHFGYYTNQPAQRTLRTPKDESSEENGAGSTATNSPPKRKLIREPEYESLSAYFNLDNGAGKIRGIHLQGNEAVRPIFRRWIAPLADLGAETITYSNTGSTDHISFDSIGLPGFQFIQDPLDYSTRTHHSNQDVFDRIIGDDLKQASVVLAVFAYNAAMMDVPLPRKPLAD